LVWPLFTKFIVLVCRKTYVIVVEIRQFDSISLWLTSRYQRFSDASGLLSPKSC